MYHVDVENCVKEVISQVVEHIERDDTQGIIDCLKK